eukprot:Skav217420  [mRNA]  locus=scaffold2674:532342:553051:- [translate_table: standard]
MRNEMIMSQCVSTGSEELDRQLLEETKLELERGWAIGPFELDSLEYGSTISKRFALVQHNKTRLIDDFSISAVNDSCVSHNKIDLHMIDTFAAMIKLWFEKSDEAAVPAELLAKTYDLKSAYRQVPTHPDHLKYAYFAVYNCELGRPQIYQLLTLPFGATHSVYCFLRLSRMLFSVATKGLYLLTTNFYDDFILASPPTLSVSAKNSMELLFLLTGWTYARDGKKATTFETHCKALGVVFNFSRSSERLLLVDNTKSRKEELVEQLERACACRRLTKQECLVLRGRLGFADSFVHGRLGSLILKQLNEHAYGKTARLDESLLDSLDAMKQRLLSCDPRKITACRSQQWFVYTDASYETGANTGGLGGVLVDQHRNIIAWFGIPLDSECCSKLGGKVQRAMFAAENKTIVHQKLGLINCYGQKLSVTEMQSEAGAAGALHGALKAGAFSTTFTATGRCMLASESVEMVQYNALVSHLVSMERRVPVQHFFDGFRTSHEVNKVKLIDYNTMKQFINWDAVKEHHDLAMNPRHPHVQGTSQGPDIFFQCVEDTPKPRFTVGILDDVTNLSLPVGDWLNVLPKGTTECMFYGLGSDGTVGANKSAVKMIAMGTELYAQAYFEYDAKKSGGVTISHLRFAPKPIHAPYNVRAADYLAIHKPSYVSNYDMTRYMKPNGVCVINCSWSVSELESKLPPKMRRDLATKKAKLYIIDATHIAVKAGLGKRINMIMQSVFFKLSGVMPFEEAIEMLKKSIKKMYGKKGRRCGGTCDKVVQMNIDGVDASVSGITECPVPDSWASVSVPGGASEVAKGPRKIVDLAPKDFADGVQQPCNNLEPWTDDGNSLPVSAFVPGGRVPLGTSQFEKRGIAINVDMDLCTQCNKCSLICPHAAATVSPWDCTGCELCVRICPADALKLADAAKVIEEEEANWNFAVTLPDRPAWANSLFEDNAEFGFGMRKAFKQRRDYLANQDTLADKEVIMSEDLRAALNQYLVMRKDEVYLDERIHSRNGKVEKGSHAKIKNLYELPLAPIPVASPSKTEDMFGRSSFWIVGGDGWAYDIGYGGLDHVIASEAGGRAEALWS